MTTDEFRIVRRYQNASQRLEEADFTGKNAEIMRDLDSELYNSDLSLYRVESILSKLAQLDKEIDFRIDQASERQLKNLVGKINRNQLGDTELAEETLRDYKKALNKLFKFVDLEEEISFMNVSSTKGGQKFVDKSQLPGKEEVEKLLQGFRNTRDKAFLMLLYETGMRPCEILNIKWKNLEDKQSLSLCHIYRSKTFERSVPFRNAWSFLEAWREESISSDSENYVFVSLNAGEKVGYSALYRAIQRASDRVEIDSRINMKAFRKARATCLASEGFNAYQLMKFFGWDKPETALYYVRLAQNDVLEAYKENLIQSSSKRSQAYQVRHRASPVLRAN